MVGWARLAASAAFNSSQTGFCLCNRSSNESRDDGLHILCLSACLPVSVLFLLCLSSVCPVYENPSL